MRSSRSSEKDQLTGRHVFNTFLDTTFEDINSHLTSINLLFKQDNKVKQHKKLYLIANVASKCGLTEKNYKELQMLHTKYQKSGL